jgi:hypothetical protein
MTADPLLRSLRLPWYPAGMDMIYAADFSLATITGSWTFNANSRKWLSNALTLISSVDNPNNPETDKLLVALHDTHVRRFPMSTPPRLALAFPCDASKTSAL